MLVWGTHSRRREEEAGFYPLLSHDALKVELCRFWAHTHECVLRTPQIHCQTFLKALRLTPLNRGSGSF